MVWGQHFLIVVLPILCLLTGVGKVICSFCALSSFDLHFSLAFKIWDIHLIFIDGTTPELDLRNMLLYALFTLATTIWCTIAIIYRILCVGRADSGARGGLRAYRHVIEVLVESSALYSVCLILYVACSASNSFGESYLDVITPFARV